MSGDKNDEGQEYYEIEIDGKMVKRLIKYLVNGNQVKLKKELITFGSWSNGENNKCFDKAMQIVQRIKMEDELLRIKFNMLLGEWQLSYSLSHGSGLNGKKNVEDIRAELVKINDNYLDVFEVTKLKSAFDEYVIKMRGDVKKKVGTQFIQN